MQMPLGVQFNCDRIESEMGGKERQGRVGNFIRSESVFKLFLKGSMY